VTLAAAVEALRPGGCLYLVHVNADADCIGAAHALAATFGGTVGAPGGVSAEGRRLAARLGLQVDEAPDPAASRQAVVLDCSTRIQLGPLAGRVPAPVLLDHHAYGDAWEEARVVVRDASRSSTCEVVLAVLREAGFTPSPEVAFGLAVGIVSDTGSFRYANPATFRDLGYLQEVGGFRMEDVFDLLASPEDRNEFARRKAQLVAAQRAMVETVDGLLVATAVVGSFEADAGEGLVRLGADVALVATGKEAGASRVSARAAPSLAERGVHLGRLLNRLAPRFGGMGGGHEGSAGMRCPVPPEVALAAVRSELELALSHCGGD